MLVEWIVGTVAFAVFLALLPLTLGRTKRNRGKGSAVVLAIGVAFSMVLDPKANQTNEISALKEVGDAGEGESGDRPPD